MDTAKTQDHKLLALFVPIFLETFFLMLAGTVDTLMLSSIGDVAVGAVGTANTYLNVFFIFFGVISSGLIAVMTQYIGHDKKGVAVQARRVAIFINGGIGLTLALVLGLAGGPIIDLLGVSEALRADATTYIRIVGAGCVFDALIPVFSCYLRAFDKSKMSLIAAFSGNAVNVALNAVAIYALRTNPVGGVVGVGIATLVGKAVNILLCLLFGRIFVRGHQYSEREDLKKLLKSLFRVGLPAALETAVYSLAMGIIMIFVGRMDADGFNSTAKTYAQQISNFAYCASFSFAQANVIITGWNIGKGQLKGCYRSTLKASLIAIGSGVVVEVIIASVSPWLLRIFTQDAAIISVVQKLLFVDIALEVGRATNLVYGMTLKSTGDSIYPAILAVIFNAICAVGGSYLFGVALKLGVFGVFIGMALDEVLRAGFMIIRWRSGKWEKKVIVKNAGLPPEAPSEV